MAIRAIATDSQDFNNPSTTGKPGRDERLDFKNEAGDTVFSIVSDADGTASIQGDAVPKVYRATVAVGDPPEPDVLINTFTGNITWVKDATGEYVVSSADNEFTADKIFILATLSTRPGNYAAAAAIYALRNSESSISFIGGGVDDTNAWQNSDWGGVAYIEILVYP